jgi:hypothetical protein
MAMSLDYADEKLMVTVQILATGDRTLKDRLLDAFISSLHRVQPRDLPTEEMRRVFIGIREDLSWCEEGSAVATTRILDSEEARGIAERIFKLFLDVHDAARQGGSARPSSWPS